MKVQLAHNHNGEKFANGLYSRKFDGKRVYIEKGVAYSRNEKPCNVDPIKHILEQIPVINGVVWDGECIYFNPDFSDDFKKTISCAQAKKRKPDCDRLFYVVFDNAQSVKPFQEEYKHICELLGASPIAGREDILATRYPNILIAKQSPELAPLQAMKQSASFEGYMYRNAFAVYAHTRTKALLKIKAWQDTELTIIGFERGIGKYADTLGAIVVDFNGYRVGVGTGLNDSDRRFIWEHKNALMGYKCKVKYFQEENESLRFPVFLCIIDKNGNEVALQ